MKKIFPIIILGLLFAFPTYAAFLYYQPYDADTHGFTGSDGTDYFETVSGAWTGDITQPTHLELSGHMPSGCESQTFHLRIYLTVGGVGVTKDSAGSSTLTGSTEFFFGTTAGYTMEKVERWRLVTLGGDNDVVVGGFHCYDTAHFTQTWQGKSGTPTKFKSHITSAFEPYQVWNSDASELLAGSANVLWAYKLADNVSLPDFDNWGICYSINGTVWTGNRPFHIEVDDNVGTQIDALASFNSDLLTGTNNACIRAPKNISLSVGDHALVLGLYDEVSSAFISYSPSITLHIVAGAVTPSPQIISPTPTEESGCTEDGAVEYALCKTLQFTFIPTAGQIDDLTSDLTSSGIVSDFMTLKDNLSDSVNDLDPATTESDPSVDLALATPLDGGTTFNLKFINTDNSENPLADPTKNWIDTMKEWITTFLWIAFGWFVINRVYHLFVLTA